MDKKDNQKRRAYKQTLEELMQMYGDPTRKHKTRVRNEFSSYKRFMAKVSRSDRKPKVASSEY